MFLSDSEVEERLNGNRNLLPKLKIRSFDMAKIADRNLTPQAKAAVIAINTFMPSDEMGKNLPITRQGVDSIVDTASDDIKLLAENYISEIRMNGLAKIIHCLTLLDPTEVKKQVELATIAEKIANVLNKIDPPDSSGPGTAVQVNVFTPRTNNADAYEVVEVRSGPIE